MSRIVFRNANLLDGDTPARAGTTIVVEGDRIAQVTQAAVPRAAGDTDVDLQGMTLMPGMVSGHYHAAYSIGGDGIPMGAPPTQLALYALANTQKALRAGYTSLVGAGTFHDVDGRLAEAIDSGAVVGPRLIPSSRALSPKVTEDEPAEGVPWLKCWGPDDFRAAAIQEIDRGARIVKLFAAQGHAMRSCREMTYEELKAASDAAHERGARTRAHVCGAAQVMKCIEAGVDIIDHADWMTDEVIEALIAHNKFVLPSMYTPWLASNDPSLEGAEYYDKEDFEYMRAKVPVANARGVKFVPGDDYGFFDMAPHGAYSGELACYVEQVGISPLDVIRWATKFGGEMTGIADLGTIEPGKLADMVIVDGDPSADIRVLLQPERIVAVLKGGALVSGHLPAAQPAMAAE
ncbi:amidohydrolase family protein [Iodidimonas sp. SYSU 1G8]|uniref:amidohydrolase family protein n=1 Tax=Iodidimonas sp. SYSU 1G8 TaxID=3133967 RepID=UPI0031FE99CC